MRAKQASRRGSAVQRKRSALSRTSAASAGRKSSASATPGRRRRSRGCRPHPPRRAAETGGTAAARWRDAGARWGHRHLRPRPVAIDTQKCFQAELTVSSNRLTVTRALLLPNGASARFCLPPAFALFWVAGVASTGRAAEHRGREPIRGPHSARRAREDTGALRT